MSRISVLTLMPPDTFLIFLFCSAGLILAHKLFCYSADMMQKGIDTALAHALDMARYPDLVAELCVLEIFACMGAMMGFCFAYMLAHSLAIASWGALFSTALTSLYWARICRERGTRSGLYTLFVDAGAVLAKKWHSLTETAHLPVDILRQQLVLQSSPMNIRGHTAFRYVYDKAGFLRLDLSSQQLVSESP